jgi:uncharacterized phiE125 gp8 family phage protein
MQNMIIDLKRVVDLSTEPVSLNEAKTQLRITYTADDAEITSMIKRARKQIENYCNISIVPQRIQLLADLVVEWALPYGPVVGIEAVMNRDSNTGSGVGGYQTSTSDWSIDGDVFDPGDGSYTCCGDYSSSAFRYKVIYTAGMNTVPDDLKQGILKQVVWLYEHRGEEGLEGISPEAKGLVDPYKIMLWL